MSRTLFGAVMWINGEPILDGMRVFETEEERNAHIESEKKLLPSCLSKKVNWRVITVELGGAK